MEFAFEKSAMQIITSKKNRNCGGNRNIKSEKHSNTCVIY